MVIVEYIKKKVLGKKYSSDSYINYLRSIGMKIGENVLIVDVKDFVIDTTRPYLVEIGNNITFSDHVTIMTHDYSWSVVARKYIGEIYPVTGKVHIGDNVFIGTHATILRGVSIGENSIVGAGSIVTKDVEPNMVYAGIPARPIMTIEEYKEKIKKQSEESLSELINEYKKRNPDKEVDDYLMREHLSWYKTREELKKNHQAYYARRQLEKINHEVNKFNTLEELVSEYLKN